MSIRREWVYVDASNRRGDLVDLVDQGDENAIVATAVVRRIDRGRGQALVEIVAELRARARGGVMDNITGSSARWTRAPEGPGWYWLRLRADTFMALVYACGPEGNGSRSDPFVHVYRDDASIGSGARAGNIGGLWCRIPKPP